jgi:hypothetical protein
MTEMVVRPMAIIASSSGGSTKNTSKAAAASLFSTIYIFLGALLLMPGVVKKNER